MYKLFPFDRYSKKMLFSPCMETNESLFILGISSAFITEDIVSKMACNGPYVLKVES